MNVKKVTKKDRYGNSTTVEYEAPTKPLDPTALMKAQMEEQHSHAMHMMQAPPPVGGEEFVPGNPMTHPGEPKGQDTVPAWLTPGEFVVNAEAMSIPENAAMVEQINNQGRAMQEGGGVEYANRGKRIVDRARALPSAAIGWLAMQDPRSMAETLATMADYGHMAGLYNDGGEVSWREKLGFSPEQMELVKGFWQDPLNQIPSYEQYAPEVWTKFVPQYENDGGMIPMMPDEYMVKQREGYNPEVYIDTQGHPTTGYGHKLPANYTDEVGNQPFSEAELNMFFDKDIATAQRAAKENIGLENFEQLNRQQQAALTSMAFQLGPAGQRKFKKMIAAIQAGDHTAAAYEALTGSEGGKSKWLRQTPKRALDLAEAFDPNVAAQYRQAGGSIYEDDMSTMTMDIPFDPNATFDAPAFDPGGGLDYSGEFDGISVSPISDTQSAITTSAGPKILRDPIPEPTPAPEPTGRGEHWLMGYGVDDYWKGMGPGGEFEQFLEHGFEDVAEPGHVNIDPDTPQGEIYQELLGQEIHDDLLSGERTIWDPEIAEGDSQELDALKAHNANLWKDEARRDLEQRPSSATLEEYKEAEAYAEATNAEYKENTKERNKAAEDRARKKESDRQEIAEILNDVPPEDRGTTKTKKPTVETDPQGDVTFGEPTQPEGEQPPAGTDLTTVEKTGTNDPGAVSWAKSMFKDLGLDSLFDKKELARMAVMYAGSRLLGYDHGGSFTWAANQYITRVDAKNAATDKFIMENVGKFTPESMKAFKDSGDPTTLVSVGTPLEETGESKRVYRQGKQLDVRKVKQGDNVYWVDSKNQPIDQSWQDDEATVYGTPAYNKKVKEDSGVYTEMLRDMRKTFGTIKGGRDQPDTYRTEFAPSVEGRNIAEWAAANGVNPLQMDDIVRNAYHDAIQHGQATGERVRDITPFLNKQYISAQVGDDELFKRVDGGYVNAGEVTKLMKSVQNETDQTTTAIIQAYRAAWNNLTPEERNQYSASAGKGLNGFMMFIRDDMAKEKANSA